MKPTEMNCNYCNQMSESEGHKNCKYKMFDVLKFGIEHEINELQTQLRKLRFDNSILKDENIKLKNDKASLMTENSALKTQILESEKQASQMNYSFEPATIKEEKADLNNAIINSNTDLTSPGSPKTKYISTNNNSDILNSESSNDSTGELKTRIKDIPKRKSIPYHNSDSLNKETLISPSCVQWTMKSDDKKTNTNKENLFPYSFLQPMEKDPLLAKNYDKSALRDDNERLHLSLTSSPKLGLNGRQKVIKKSPKNILRQTILKFPRNLTEMENSILNYCENEDDNENETFCEDLIQPTPGNSTLYRSRSSTRKYSPNKLANLDININTSTLDKKTRESEASVLCVSPSSNAVITIPDSPTIHFESDLKNSFDYGKNTKREQQGLALFGKTSPIRLNAEKAKQPGFDCPDCEKYYGIVGHKLSDAEIQKRLDKCSKHRKNIRYHETPSGFWNPKFTPTQNSMN